MRRFILILCLLLVACQGSFNLTGLPTLTSSTKPSSIPSQTATITPSPVPTLTETPIPTPTLAPSNGYQVRFHPDGAHFSGDLISIEVIAPSDQSNQDQKVVVSLDGNPPQELGEARFEPFGIGGRDQATFTWLWNTKGLPAGDYLLHFSIAPAGVSWSEPLNLLASDEVPPPEPGTRWENVESQCCVIYYISGTEAEDNISDLVAIAEANAQETAQQMGLDFTEPIQISILPRVVGHGGFASNEISISYLNRNYAGNDYARVLHHEMVHILDGRLGGEMRPSILVEGLAVYLSGGHYKEEPIIARAAALLQLGWFIPLRSLTDSFYTSQHEISYLEGAALIQYMVDTYGWEAYNDFYRDIHPQSSGSQSEALDAALKAHFDLSLEALEQQFKAYLAQQPVDNAVRTDLQLTVAFFDTIRRYQQLLDPSAYFLTAWLPSSDLMRERGIVSDYVRRPTESRNITIERLLVKADQALKAGDYFSTDLWLAEIERRLNEVEWLTPVQIEQAEIFVTK
jgi:hypothetical protein